MRETPMTPDRVINGLIRKEREDRKAAKEAAGRVA
jgi:hypothetical protein